MKTVQFLTPYGAHAAGEFANFSDTEAEFIFGANSRRQKLGAPAVNLRMLVPVLRKDDKGRTAEQLLGKSYAAGAKKGQAICVSEKRAQELIRSKMAVELVMATVIEPFKDALGHDRQMGSFACTAAELADYRSRGVADEFVAPFEAHLREKQPVEE